MENNTNDVLGAFPYITREPVIRKRWAYALPIHTSYFILFPPPSPQRTGMVG
jgi:hypothetical protein